MASRYDWAVHEHVLPNGTHKFYVGIWRPKEAQYWWPISKESQRKSGNWAGMSRTLAGFNGDYAYDTRQQALAAARRIFREEP